MIFILYPNSLVPPKVDICSLHLSSFIFFPMLEGVDLFHMDIFLTGCWIYLKSLSYVKAIAFQDLMVPLHLVYVNLSWMISTPVVVNRLIFV